MPVAARPWIKQHISPLQVIWGELLLPINMLICCAPFFFSPNAFQLNAPQLYKEFYLNDGGSENK